MKKEEPKKVEVKEEPKEKVSKEKPSKCFTKEEFLTSLKQDEIEARLAYMEKLLNKIAIEFRKFTDDNAREILRWESDMELYSTLITDEQSNLKEIEKQSIDKKLQEAKETVKTLQIEFNREQYKFQNKLDVLKAEVALVKTKLPSLKTLEEAAKENDK